jgi:hypothetical protein
LFQFAREMMEKEVLGESIWGWNGGRADSRDLYV